MTGLQVHNKTSATSVLLENLRAVRIVKKLDAYLQILGRGVVVKALRY